MTATALPPMPLLLPWPLCEVCEHRQATGTLLPFECPICRECGENAPREEDDPPDEPLVAWWTEADIGCVVHARAADGSCLICGDGDPANARTLCPCGEVRDDFGACWKCDTVRA